MASVVSLAKPPQFLIDDGITSGKVTVDTGSKLIQVSTDEPPILKLDGSKLTMKIRTSNHHIDCMSVGGASATMKHLILIMNNLFNDCERIQRKINVNKEQSRQYW
jgi:hypothetical protein